LETESRIYQVLPLAQVDNKLVGDARNVDGGESRDTTARDRIESVATVVRPLGRSADSFDPEARNCQDWMGDVVERLISEGFVGCDARVVLRSAPKKL
jgi:hypothetical protein